MFPPFKVAFREQLVQKELSVFQRIEDAAAGARTAGTTGKPSWTTMCRVPSPAFFGQHGWFCVGPLAMGSLEAGAVVGEGFGAGSKAVLCSRRCAHSHRLQGKADVTPGSCSPSLPGRRATITCELCLRWLSHLSSWDVVRDP